MCGIVGNLNFEQTELVNPRLMRLMCSTLTHRGPDDEGVYVDRNVGLGMRRLSIIDLDGGAQPISNEDGSVVVVCNGEIYNYRQWQKTLSSWGHQLSTQSDTEVIVHLYEEFGLDFVNHLRGMFAIALWDKARDMLVLVRDRMGIKPLYYSVRGKKILFGSELKALLAAGMSREINTQALHDFLSFNYIPGPSTIFSDAKKLQPGSRLVCARGQVTVEPYWQLQIGSTHAQRVLPEAHYVDRLQYLLRDSVACRLVSDVPLGVFLSGGVDSSALVALMREVSSGPIKTFSIGFEDSSYSELPYARQIAELFETDHHELLVRPDAVDLLPKLVRFFDEPFADSSAIPTYYLSELARRDVTVALGGDGGDEVFAGYETYLAYKMARYYRRLPGVCRRLAPWAVGKLPVSHAKISFDYKAKRFLNGAMLLPEQGHFAWKEIFSRDMKDELYAVTKNVLFEDSFRVFERELAACSGLPPLSRLQYIDQRVYLPDDILVKVDRMSMAHSLELRVPLIDHKLVEFAATVPPEMHLKGMQKKYLLKRALARRLPGRILNRKKGGFNVPVPGWLRGDLRDYTRDILSDRILRKQGFFNPRYVQKLIDDHNDMKVDYSRNIWGLLIFTLWCESIGSGVSRSEAFTGEDTLSDWSEVRRSDEGSSSLVAKSEN